MTMPAPDFAAQHAPALERDQVMHNVLLAGLGRLAAPDPPALRLWSLGAPGACALQMPNFPIVLGDLTEAQCHALAEETRDLDYPGVVGPEQTAPWFAARAAALGVSFMEPIPQQIYALYDTPRYPEGWGCTRLVGARDAVLFAEWTLAFMREAVPHDPLPVRQRLEQAAADSRYQFWISGHRPVSMAGLVRRTRDAGAVGGVYTPPEFRGRGFASAVTAAVADRIFGEGKSAVCLFADLRNPVSNRCYARIGFKPHCRSWHYPRARA